MLHARNMQDTHTHTHTHTERERDLQPYWVCQWYITTTSPLSEYTYMVENSILLSASKITATWHYRTTTTLVQWPFPRQPGQAGSRISPVWILLQLRMMETVMTTGAIGRAKLQSNHHQQQTNTHLFTGWMRFLSPNSVEALKRNDFIEIWWWWRWWRWLLL